MIVAHNLSKVTGEHHALNNLNLNMAPGEIFCLLGQNGAGKTTTINCFPRIPAPSAGKPKSMASMWRSDPQGSKRPSGLLARSGDVVPQTQRPGKPRLLQPFGRIPLYSKTNCRSFCSKAGLPGDSINRYVGTYSKGMRQKVGIAIATAKQAKALFLDEPTSGLDPKASNDFSLLLKTTAQEGVAILMATHDIFRAKDVATRVGIMREGQLVATHAANEFSATELEKIYLETV
nr:ATP-binding cassette domain-containing protein [Haliscomenobacter sp.]